MSQLEGIAAAAAVAETKFWNSPELVDTLLGFLDGLSTLTLAEAHRKTSEILQSSIGWKKFLKRSLPSSESMDRNLDKKKTYYSNFEFEFDSLELVGALLNLVDEDEEAEAYSLKVADILHPLCRNFPPDGPDYVDVSFSCSHKESFNKGDLAKISALLKSPKKSIKLFKETMQGW